MKPPLYALLFLMGLAQVALSARQLVTIDARINEHNSRVTPELDRRPPRPGQIIGAAPSTVAPPSAPPSAPAASATPASAPDTRGLYLAAASGLCGAVVMMASAVLFAAHVLDHASRNSALVKPPVDAARGGAAS